MNRKRILLTSILLSILLGWAAGFLRLPYLDTDHTFLVGFSAGIALCLLVFLVLNLLGKNSEPGMKLNSFWSMMILTVVVSSLLSIFCMFQINRSLKHQLDEKDDRIEDQSRLIESSSSSAAFDIVKEMLQLIEEELQTDSDKKLSPESIDKLKALNYSLKPYRILEADSLTTQTWSPERGQLLLSLGRLNMDASSFKRIKEQLSFEKAYLPEADLRSLDLSGMDLSGANLREAILNEADLTSTNLTDVKLWGAKLRASKMAYSQMQRADLRWSDLSGADLSHADLNGADLSDAKLAQADLDSLTMEWAKMRNAYLAKANFSDANLRGTDIGNSILAKANFSNANMHLVNFSGSELDSTNLSNTILTKATVLERDWIDQLENKYVVDAEAIQKDYKCVVEISGKYNFRLVKK